MLISELADVRTGLVISRKKADDDDSETIKYKVLNLKCLKSDGQLDLNQAYEMKMKERLNAEYLTHKDDILVRLSSPYNAVYIADERQFGYVIPSHFAIVRAYEKKSAPEYLYWFLTRDFISKKIVQNISGSTVFGTISSGFFAKLKIPDLPFAKQQIIGKYSLLADREQKLLIKLMKQKEILNKAMAKQIYEIVKRGNE